MEHSGNVLIVIFKNHSVGSYGVQGANYNIHKNISQQIYKN